MAGLALTDNFMLSTASVMIGPVEDLHDLNPADNAIGLVKNFQINSEPSYTELMQGVKGSVVFSTMTANPVRASMEAYEYTARNLKFALGLDGSTTNPMTINTTVATIVPASPAQKTLVLASGAGANFSPGDTILIDKNGDDDFVIRKVVSKSTDTLTLDEFLPAIAVGTAVYKVNAIDVGSKADQPFLSAKIAGKLANGKPAVILIPKMRITKGFAMAFSSENYGNLPLEFTLYDLVATDPAYAYFAGAQAKLFTR